MHRLGQRIPIWAVALIVLLILAAQAAILLAMGRSLICPCGTVELWHGLRDAGNSQHIFDLFSFTHIIHGFLLYLVLWLTWRRAPVALRLLLAVAIEGAWEILENSDFVIARYRSLNASRTYPGDSIINSVSDTLTMAFGFLLAARLPASGVVALALVFEAGLAYAIHDNLAINIMMLIHRFEAISAWQAAAPLR
jgi:hypothetical protein